MSEETSSPLHRAVLRNYLARRLRNWNLFRALAGGIEIPPRLQGILSIIESAAEPVEDGINHYFDVPHEMETLVSLLTQYTHGEVAVGVCMLDGPIEHSFAAPIERVVAALPFDLAEQDRVLIGTEWAVCRLALVMRPDNSPKIWLSIVQRSAGGEWFDAFGEMANDEE